MFERIIQPRNNTKIIARKLTPSIGKNKGRETSRFGLERDTGILKALACLLIGFRIMHDASHCASIFRNPKIPNRTFVNTLDGIWGSYLQAVLLDNKSTQSGDRKNKTKGEKNIWFSGHHEME